MLPNRVTTLREALGMSQVQLSRKANISPATISRLERGQIKQIKSDALKRLAIALNENIDTLINHEVKETKIDLVKHDLRIMEIISITKKLSPTKRNQLLSFAKYLADGKSNAN